MSAVPPIAAELVTRGSPSLGAISGCEQSQQKMACLFDDLVGAGQQHGDQLTLKCRADAYYFT